MQMKIRKKLPWRPQPPAGISAAPLRQLFHFSAGCAKRCQARLPAPLHLLCTRHDATGSWTLLPAPVCACPSTVLLLPVTETAALGYLSLYDSECELFFMRGACPPPAPSVSSAACGSATYASRAHMAHAARDAVTPRVSLANYCEHRPFEWGWRAVGLCSPCLSG